MYNQRNIISAIFNIFNKIITDIKSKNVKKKEKNS